MYQYAHFSLLSIMIKNEITFDAFYKKSSLSEKHILSDKQFLCMICKHFLIELENLKEIADAANDIGGYAPLLCQHA